jgi:diaminopimelate decarboxylase
MFNLLVIISSKGLGAECASIGEILNCLDAGFASDKIVYDSPVKAAPEISKLMVR